jgi:hypothetical protein
MMVGTIGSAILIAAIIIASAANAEDGAGEHVLASHPGEGEESGRGVRWPPPLATQRDDIVARTEKFP